MNYSTIKLRKWTWDDLNGMVQYANNQKIADNLTNVFPHPYTLEDGKKWLEGVLKESKNIILAIDLNGEAIGAIGIHPQEDIMCKNAELGYWLGEEHWGKGYVTSAVKMMVEIGFKELDITRIFARPFGSNIGSQKVLEKCGFTLEARLKDTIFKNGRFEDELIYSLRRSKS